MPHYVAESESTARELAHEFLARHRISLHQPPEQLLHQIAAAFSMLPYENLSKVLRDAQGNLPEEIRRLPSEVLSDYYRFGAGGTCFSLTWTLLHLLRALGFHAEPLLADRRYGLDTHSALVVWIDGVKHLLDPGYLLTKPVPLAEPGRIIVPTSFHELQLQPEATQQKLELHTQYQDKLTYRLTYKTEPVDTATFLKAWDASFDFDMMKYPVLSRILTDKQYYLQKNRLMIRSRDATQLVDLTAETLPAAMQQHFGLHPSLIQQALPHFESSAR